MAHWSKEKEYAKTDFPILFTLFLVKILPEAVVNSIAVFVSFFYFLNEPSLSHNPFYIFFLPENLLSMLLNFKSSLKLLQMEKFLKKQAVTNQFFRSASV